MTKIKVGIFLAAGLAVLTVSVFMLGANKSLFQRSYKLVSYFDSVQGLGNGAIVSLAGVKIGNIDTISFDEQKNLVQIIFLVDAKYSKKIKTDSVVEIRTQGALGDKYLYITPGTKGEPIHDMTEIKSDYGNDILSIIGKRGSESEKIFDMIADMNKIVKGLAEQNKITSVINKLDQTAGNLNDVSAKLKLALGNGQIEKSMTKLDSILEKVDNGQGTLGALINDKSLHERLKSILGAGQKQQQVKSIIKSSVEE